MLHLVHSSDALLPYAVVRDHLDAGSLAKIACTELFAGILRRICAGQHGQAVLNECSGGY